ncbi:MAG TPA: hypothetical protein VN814_24895 [Caulobacteraceae bacterium]|nr:hypothetical protein [Caulobacteraceae bacterium]
MDLAAMVIFLSLALAVYAFKTSAGAERTDIADVEDKIVVERHDVRLLQDQIARLENPKRLEDRATRFGGLARISAKQEVTPEALPQVAGPQLVAPPAAAPAVAASAMVASPVAVPPVATGGRP